MSKYCTACGTQLDDEASFCSKCGTKIVDIENVVPEKIETRKNSPINKKHINKYVLIISIFLVICIIIGTILGLTLKSHNSISLPTIDTFEKNLSSELKSFYKELGYNAKKEGWLPTEYKYNELGREMINGDNMSFSCTYGPNISINGYAKDKEINWLYAIIVFPSAQAYDEDYNETRAAVMLPATLFSDKYNDYNSLLELYYEIMDYGSFDEETGEWYIVDENIEYRISSNEYYIGFSINVIEEAIINKSNTKKGLSRDEMFDFYYKMDGIWVDKNSCEVYGNSFNDVSFSFVSFEKGCIYTGSVPGSFSRAGEIVKIVQEKNKYILSLFYREEEYFEEFYPEEYFEVELVMSDNSFYFRDSKDICYTYVGKNLDETIELLIQEKKDTFNSVENTDYTIPYCGDTFSKIGEKFSEFYVPGTGLQYGSGSLYILMMQQYSLDRGDWEAYSDYNGYHSRIGVKNDRIIINVQELAEGVTVREALPDSMLNVEPLICYGYDEDGLVLEQSLFWKGTNGYMIGFVEANNYYYGGSYLDEKVKYFISTTDLNYLCNIPEIVLELNPAFN